MNRNRIFNKYFLKMSELCKTSIFINEIISSIDQNGKNFTRKCRNLLTRNNNINNVSSYVFKTKEDALFKPAFGGVKTFVKVDKLTGYRILRLRTDARTVNYKVIEDDNPRVSKKRLYLSILSFALGSGGVLLYYLEKGIKAGSLELHPPKLPWSHRGYLSALDKNSMKRGWEVYKQVCSACHSLQHVCYREFINVIYTEAEAKKEAEEIQVTDGPNEEGEMFQRPGKLSDHVPSPYPNQEAARAANNGAYPPDLTYILPGRHGEEDYVFHLLTGYCDPPAGIVVREGQFYNPYFATGTISMAPPLYNEIIEFTDGTKATLPQCAKDVITFLKWTSEPEHDVSKKMAVKVVVLFSILIGASVYLKRLKWSSLHSRKIQFHYKKENKD